MATALKNKNIGSIIKIKINGTVTDFILTNLGAPNSSYKNANGAWLTQKNIYNNQVFNSSSDQAYANSSIKTWLENTYLNYIESELQPYILTPTLPIAAGKSISATTTKSKVFLLSITETGAITKNNDGSKLSYFSDNSSRIAYYNGSASYWWTRSPYSYYSNTMYYVNSIGDWNYINARDSCGVRPTFIVDSLLQVDDNGYIIYNAPPVISSSLGVSGTDLGEKKDVFDVIYSVSYFYGDALTITEKIDNITINTRTNISSGSSLTFSNLNNLTSFQTILNGKHTLEIIANDGKASTSFTFTFTKKVTEADITLKEALAVEGDISVAILKIEGSIPEDAILTVLVTNNGKDSNPVWQDATTQVLNNKNIVFTNKENINGAAFNFKVNIKRGPSDEGGYITSINGAFQ